MSNALKNALVAVELAEKTRDPITATYNKFLGDLYVKKRDYVKAEASYERSLAQGLAWTQVPSNSCKNAHGPIAVNLADSERNFKLVKKKLTAQRPTIAWIMQNFPMGGTVFDVSSKDKTIAEKHIGELEERILCGRTRGPGPLLVLGSSYQMVGRTEDAVIVLLVAAISYPEDAEVWRELGWTYLLQGRLENALAAFDTSAKLGNKFSRDVISPVKRLMTSFHAPRAPQAHTNISGAHISK